jgi:hypothetical protein
LPGTAPWWLARRITASRRRRRADGLTMDRISEAALQVIGPARTQQLLEAVIGLAPASTIAQLAAA